MGQAKQRKQSQDAAPVGANEVSVVLSAEKIKELQGALAVFSTPFTVTMVGPQGEQTVTRMARFRRGSIYAALAKNASAVAKVLQPVNEAHVSLVREHSKEGSDGTRVDQEDPAVWKSFSEKYTDLMADTHKLVVRPINVDDLILEDNPIPIDKLRALMDAGVVVE